MKDEKRTPRTGRKTYRSPALSMYGKVSKLTTSGSQGNPEGGSGRLDKKE